MKRITQPPSPSESSAPIIDSVKKYCAQKTGRKAEGLWGFVASFRAEEKKRTDKAQQKRESKCKSTGARGEEGVVDDDVEPNKTVH